MDKEYREPCDNNKTCCCNHQGMCRKSTSKTCKRRRKSCTRSVLTLNNVLIGSKRFIMSDNDDEG